MGINIPFPLPLRPHFAEFIWYEHFFFPGEVEIINGHWLPEAESKATLSGAQSYDEDLRLSSVIFLEPTAQNDWIYKKLGMIAAQCNAERFGFDLYGFYQELQLTQYEEGNFFEWHMDFGAGEISARKLSITVQLTDPDEYEGGDLQFMINNKIVDAPRGKGTVIVFPSFVMHRVTPVRKGVRRSIVGWVSGPPYR